MMWKPSWDEESGKDVLINYERAHALDPSHHLNTEAIRKTVIKTMEVSHYM